MTAPFLAPPVPITAAHVFKHRAFPVTKTGSEIFEWDTPGDFWARIACSMQGLAKLIREDHAARHAEMPAHLTEALAEYRTIVRDTLAWRLSYITDPQVATILSHPDAEVRMLAQIAIAELMPDARVDPRRRPLAPHATPPKPWEQGAARGAQ